MTEHERLRINPENRAEKPELHREQKKHLEHLREKAKEAEIHHDVHELHKSAHEKAVSSSEVTIGEKPGEPQPIIGTQREIKLHAYRRTLQKTRAHLSKPQQTLSKIVHQPTIEATSELGAKTVARPSGILGGGVFALLGSGLILYASKHFGFSYNFTVFFLLFVSGFFVGLLVETALRLIRRQA